MKNLVDNIIYDAKPEHLFFLSSLLFLIVFLA